MLHPEPGGRNRELLARVHSPVGDREEREGAERHTLQPGAGVERGVEEKMSAFMCGKAGHGSAQERHNRGTALLLPRHRVVRNGAALCSRRFGGPEANR